MSTPSAPADGATITEYGNVASDLADVYTDATPGFKLIQHAIRLLNQRHAELLTAAPRPAEEAASNKADTDIPLTWQEMAERWRRISGLMDTMDAEKRAAMAQAEDGR